MNPTLATNKWKAAFSWESLGVAVLLLLGALLRIRQYLTGRSLWVDEAMLALNIVNRNFAGMFKPLDYDQGSPIGFLLAEKIFNVLLGKNEFALRLFPLLVGLISLWLFTLLLERVFNCWSGLSHLPDLPSKSRAVPGNPDQSLAEQTKTVELRSRRTLSGAGLLTALALFALNPRLVYYSSEVKQYIVDVAVTISLLLIAAPLFSPAPRKKHFAWLALAGFVALWFSHPALFVLAGIGLALVIMTLQRRDYSSLRALIGIGLLWLLDFAFLYLLVLKDLSRNPYMREYWQGAFLPVPPWSDPAWFTTTIAQDIKVQFGMPYAVFLVFALMLVGWIVLFFQNRPYALAFACILFTTLTASALQFYPVFERMILFLVPIGIILLGKSVEALYQWSHKSRPLGVFAVCLLAGALLYGPAVTSLHAFIQPKYPEHIRPTMDYLHASWKDGDAMFVSNGALPAFRFYVPFYGLERVSYQFGRREDYQHPENILRQLDAFKGQPRLWVLFSHVYEKGDFNEKDYLVNYLNQIGDKKREFRVPGTSVYLYLYDLKNK
ncbi:MAG TPA: hypothetical protein VK249_03785 [Anaerolineales bacterium]|nr:hypothetical protein [Anaerolineales bacterium]